MELKNNITLSYIFYFCQKFRRMKKICILLFLAVQVSFANNVFWGKTGHRTVGEVAQKELSRKAKKMKRSKGIYKINLLKSASSASSETFS